MCLIIPGEFDVVELSTTVSSFLLLVDKDKDLIEEFVNSNE
jgi:hypothetical protein